MRNRRHPTNERPEPEDLPAERDDPRSSHSEGGRHLRPWGGQQALIKQKNNFNERPVLRHFEILVQFLKKAPNNEKKTHILYKNK
jgi:hypothetical protein